jgi:hypothetical protein
MRFLFLALSLLVVQPASAYFYKLECSANYQPQVGKDTETKVLASADPKGFGDVKLASDLKDYSYEVVWHKAFDTFYMTIRKGDYTLVSATARVPSFEHNDTMVDVTLPDGVRRWISCGFKPK